MSKNYNMRRPLARAVSLIEGRWTLLILSEFLEHESRRFHDLEQVFPGLAPNTLSERLKKLEKAGVIKRDLYKVNPLRAHYFLTDVGKELGPIISALEIWGRQFVEVDSDKR